MFGGSSWLVGVRLSFATNGFSTMSRLSSSTKLANAQLQFQQGFLSKNDLALMRYKERIEGLRGAFLKLGTTMAAVFAGIGFAGIGSAVTDAAKLQQILLSIKNETGASSAQMGRFYNAAFNIGDQNGMTPEQAGEILRTVTRLRTGNFPIEKMLQVAPGVADFASKVHFNRPDISVETAAKTGLQMSDLFRAYQPGPLANLLDKNYRLSGMMAEGPDAALRQMSYYVPLFKALGVSDDTSVATMALLDRAGFRNKIGSNVRAEVLKSLGPLEVTQHAQAGKADILKQMGLLDSSGKFAWNNKDGTLNYFGELGSISTWAQAQRNKGIPATKISEQMFSALGAQGGTVGALFLDKQIMPILAGIKNYLKDPNVGLAAATRNRDAGTMFQFTRAMHNFQAVMTELAYPWLVSLTKVFKGLADSLHGFQQWLHGHRGAEKVIGAGVAGATVVAGGLAAAGLGSLALRGLGLVGIFDKLGTVLKSPFEKMFVKLFGSYGGKLGKAGLFGINWVYRLSLVGDAITAFIPRIAMFGARFVPIIGWVLTAIEVFRHASDIAWVLGKMAGFMKFKLWPGIVSAFQAGINWIGSAFHGAITGMFSGLHSLISNPMGALGSANRTIGGAITGGTNAVGSWFGGVTNAMSAGFNSEKPAATTVNIHVTANGHPSPHKAGQVVGAAIAHELAKHGLIRNHTAPGFNNAVPAAH